LEEDRLVHRRQPTAPVLLRPREAGPAALVQGALPLLGALVLLGLRRRRGVGQRPEGLVEPARGLRTERGLLGGVTEVHVVPSRSSGGPGTVASVAPPTRRLVRVRPAHPPRQRARAH